jgi:urea transport system substrate-binding protein
MRIGLLFSLTGPHADMGSTIADGALLAISEINDAGGVLGEPLEVEIFDTRSEVSRAPAGVRSLVNDRSADAIVGTYMSACRVATLPVLRELDTLLLYPTYFEGGEIDPRVFYCGASPNQFLPEYLSWIAANLGRRIHVIGSDYIYPRELSEAIRRTAPQLGIDVLGDSYVPIGETDFREAARLRTWLSAIWWVPSPPRPSTGNYTTPSAASP